MSSVELRDVLFCLPQDQIIDIVGKDIVDLMKEWGDGYLNKNSLVSMAASLKGGSVFEDVSHRDSILKANLSPERVLSMGNELRVGGQDLVKILEKCKNYSWKNDVFARCVLKNLNLSYSYLSPATVFEDGSEEINPIEKFYELLDYQFLIKTALLAWITKRDLARCLIHMPTGSGKTKTCMHSIIEYWNFVEKNNGVILWLAHSEELLRQALYTFKQCWGHLGTFGVRVNKFWGGFELDLDSSKPNIIFGGIAKFISFKERNKDEYEDLKKRVSLLVIDEAHKAKANKTSRLIEDVMLKLDGYSNRSLIGLSATPGRSLNDIDENKKLANMFEDKIISIPVDALQDLRQEKSVYQNLDDAPNIVPYLQERKILATFNREIIEIAEEESNLNEDEMNQAKKEMTSPRDNADISDKILSKLAKNHLRNKRILNKLIKLQEDNVPVIVFACTASHAKMLTAALHIRKVPAGCVLGETNKSERSKIIKNFLDDSNDLNILINYEVLTTGFDAPNIKCVFITRPTHSIVLYSQMIGRGLRGPKMGGNASCLLVDVEDNILKFSNESLAFNYFSDYWRR